MYIAMGVCVCVFEWANGGCGGLPVNVDISSVPSAQRKGENR